VARLLIVGADAWAEPRLTAQPFADEAVVEVKVLRSVIIQKARKQLVEQVHLIQAVVLADIAPDDGHDGAKVTAFHKVTPPKAALRRKIRNR